MINQKGYGIISALVNVVFGIIISLVALRLLFMLFGANAANGFVQWVYSASQPLVAPFAGIFDNIAFMSGRLEMQTLVALVVYTLAASIVNWLLMGSRRHSTVA